MGRILLTDGLQRKTLAATRSLGAEGHAVWVGDPSRFSLSRFSRHCQRGLVSPDPANARDYRDWLVGVQRRHQLDALVPMDDLTTEIAVAHERALPYRMLVPTREQFMAGRDKGRTIALAREAGVACPLTLPVSTLAEAQAAVAALGGNAVVKPCISSGGRGVTVVASAGAVAAAWRRVQPDWGGVLVQERIPAGRKCDVCLLFGPAGDLRASFVQEELRWFPLEHGTSTLQESVHRPDLVALALRLLAPIGWRGPVEVEFMIDAAGEPVLMEINPRFWASVALAIRCGVDFPGLTAALAMGASVAGPATYPAGIRCRWSLPGDLLHAWAKRGRNIEPPFFATMDERTFDDILSGADPGPVLGFALAGMRHLLDVNMWRMVMRW